MLERSLKAWLNESIYLVTVCYYVEKNGVVPPRMASDPKFRTLCHVYRKMQRVQLDRVVELRGIIRIGNFAMK